MYTIYCDDICIYNDIAADKAARLIAPTVEWQDNAAGTLTFTMPECNTGYNAITLMQSFIVVKKYDEEIWWGRPIKESRDFWRNKTITCEGCLAFLNDVIQPQRMFEQGATGVQPPIYSFDGFPEQFINVLLAYHNQNSRYKFNLRKCTVRKYMVDEDDNDEYYEYIVVKTDFKNTLECISEKLINKEEIGGHIMCKRDSNGIFQLEYIQEPDEGSAQTIEFGKNLLDFTTNFDDTAYCTVLYPRGESLGDSEVDGLTAYLELDPDKDGDYSFSDDDHPTPIQLHQTAPRLINPEGVAAYGWVERVMDFSEAKDEEKLLAKAGEWMTKNRFKDMELEIKAFDLAYMDINYQDIKFMQNIHVISLPHGLDRNFPVLGISIPLDQPQNATYTLGKKKVASLSAHTSSVTAEAEKTQDFAEHAHNKDWAEIQKAVQDYIRRIDEAVDQAARDATQKIKTATTGRIGIKQNSYGADALVIIPTLSDQEFATLDIEHCNKPMWVWNYEGLGFLQNGWNGTRKANVAITNDGRIVANDISACTITANQIRGGSIEAGQISSIYINADWIKTGHLSADFIQGGHITADTIAGGTLRLTSDMKIISETSGQTTTLQGGVLSFYAGLEVQASYVGGIMGVYNGFHDEDTGNDHSGLTIRGGLNGDGIVAIDGTLWTKNVTGGSTKYYKTYSGGLDFVDSCSREYIKITTDAEGTNDLFIWHRKPNEQYYSRWDTEYSFVTGYSYVEGMMYQNGLAIAYDD